MYDFFSVSPDPFAKRQLDRFVRFYRVYRCDQQTDRPRYICSNRPHLALVLWCSLKSHQPLCYKIALKMCLWKFTHLVFYILQIQLLRILTHFDDFWQNCCGESRQSDMLNLPNITQIMLLRTQKLLCFTQLEYCITTLSDPKQTLLGSSCCHDFLNLVISAGQPWAFRTAACTWTRASLPASR